MVEIIYGCKCLLIAYQLLVDGVNRPGEMVRSVEGLSTKVLNACLKRNVEFGILQKVVYHELPPRVDYKITPVGEKFISILEHIESLQQELELRDDAEPVPKEINITA